LELVYLWIDKYKNIEKQGFCLSSKYNCKFDIENIVLELQTRKKNIFSPNIDIVAIVGKNGSGKSSIFKAILMLIFYNKYKELENSNNYDDKYIAKETINYTNLEDFIGFLIIKNKNKFYKLDILVDKNNVQTSFDSLFIEIDNMSSITEKINSKEIDFFTIYYNYTIGTLRDGIGDDFINLIYHRVDGYENPILIEPYKYNDNINISLLEYVSSQRFANIFRLGIKNKFIEEFFNPNFVKIQINANKLTKKIKNLSKKVYGNEYLKYSSKINITYDDNGNLFKNIKLNGIDGLLHYVINIPNRFQNSQRYEIFNKLYIALKLLEKKYDGICDYDKLIKAFFESKTIEETIQKTIELIDINKIEKKFKKIKKPKFEIQKILNAINFHKKVIKNQSKLELFCKSLDKKLKLNEIKEILEDLPPWVDIEYFENDKSYKSLSSGEKMIFSFMINLMYQVNNVKDKYKTINLFLDEIELALHPEWQRKYLYYILQTLKDFKNIKINIIFATHSPFILSDIPKENIIFLKDGKNVSDEVEIDTFGANIHTLLSHAFFMEEGLIGEFAKEKIDEVIKFLNDENSKIKNKEEAKYIINMIGEPFLQFKLLEKYELKYSNSKSKIDTRIKILEEEIKRLKNVKNKN